jgi:hypothetical protein
MTEEEFKNKFKEVWKEVIGDEPIPYKQEISPGLWKISGGGISYYTGKAGADLAEKVLKEEIQKELNDIRNNNKRFDELSGDKNNDSDTGVS